MNGTSRIANVHVYIAYHALRMREIKSPHPPYHARPDLDIFAPIFFLRTANIYPLASPQVDMVVGYFLDRLPLVGASRSEELERPRAEE